MGGAGRALCSPAAAPDWEWEVALAGEGRLPPPRGPPPCTSPALGARSPARPPARRFRTPRHFPVRREMPSTFPLSLQLLDCQMRLCALLGVFSTAPFLPEADITHCVFWLGWLGRWPPCSFRAPLSLRPARLGDISWSRKAAAPNNLANTIVLPRGGTVLPGKGDSFSFKVWQCFLLYKTDVALALHKSSCLPPLI